MDAYYIPMIVLLLLLPFDFIGRKAQPLAVLTAVLLIGLFAGLRGLGVDNDSGSYLNIFIVISNLDFFSVKDFASTAIVEPGFAYINYFVQAIGGNHLFLQVLFSVSTGLLLAYYVLKYSRYPMMSMFLYFCLFFLNRDFTQIRFGIISLLCMIAVHWFIDGHRRHALFLYLLACSIHYSAISLILFIPVWHFRASISLPVFLFVCIIAVFLSFLPIVEWVATIMGLPMQLERNLLDPGAGSPKIAVAAIMLSALLFRKNKFRLFYHRAIAICLLISGFLGIAFLNFGIMSRIQFLYGTSIILATPAILARFKGTQRLAAYGLLILCGIGYYYKLLLGDSFRPYELYAWIGKSFLLG